MKKLICAAAGLLFVGTATAAFAAPGVSFSGDARARFYDQQEYKTADSEDTHWASRVRVKMVAESKGGAYAKVRFRISDATWDGTQHTGDYSTNVHNDWAYIGVPMGPVTIEAGYVPRNLTDWFIWDKRADGIQAVYRGGNTIAMAFYDIAAEGAAGKGYNADPNVDNDVDRYGLYLNQKFNADWSMVAAAIYEDNQLSDAQKLAVADTAYAGYANGHDGFGGTVRINGQAANIGIVAEFAYKDKDLQGTPDDGYGGYAAVTVPMGAASITGLIGGTKDGYTADGNFGYFIIQSDLEAIAIGESADIGAYGDTMFVGVMPSYKVSENLTLRGCIAYSDISENAIDGGSLSEDNSNWEFSGMAAYSISDGATVYAELGYLDWDKGDQDPLGFGLSLEIAF